MRKNLSDFIQKIPDMEGTVENGNRIYTQLMKEEIGKQIEKYVPHEDKEDLRLYMYKYYNL
jgi:hypothetical protein